MVVARNVSVSSQHPRVGKSMTLGQKETRYRPLPAVA